MIVKTRRIPADTASVLVEGGVLIAADAEHLFDYGGGRVDQL
ncbi:hypothetical protein [Saccharothrix sp. ALI-22-I]|nr:hypothetical protein [Saccharothrix sp. ALI-22-I]